ncbi:MAG TPA: hypothetical protein PLQ13_05010 [Candidatus Krumholzibacteria bacterium]|nr:hypothetical protein [Candidatus Krumholzibacteria bacterium]
MGILKLKGLPIDLGLLRLAPGQPQVDGQPLELEDAERLTHQVHGENGLHRAAQVARRQAEHLEVDVAGHQAQRRVAHAAAHQPGPPAGARHQRADAPHRLVGGGIVQAQLQVRAVGHRSVLYGRGRGSYLRRAPRA